MPNSLIFLVRNAGIEPATFSSGGYKISFLPFPFFFDSSLSFNNLQEILFY